MKPTPPTLAAGPHEPMTLHTEKPQPVTDPAFLAAKIRALKAKILAGPELAKLAFLESPAALYRQVLGTAEEMPPSKAQRAVIARHARHLTRILNFTRGRERALLEWLLRRYQADNIRVVIRARARGMRLAEIEKDLIPMEGEYSLPLEQMMAAQDIRTLIDLIPEKRFADGLAPVLQRYLKYQQAFFLAAGLEKTYYTEALRRAERLKSANRQACLPMIQRETLCYNILFVLRCLQTYRLPMSEFSDLVVPYGPFGRAGYLESFGKSPIESLAVPHFEQINPEGHAVKSVRDVEEICARYLHRAAKTQFAVSIFDFGAIVAYYYLKRFELQDILRLGEAIRLGLSAEEARQRLITAGEPNA